MGKEVKYTSELKLGNTYLLIAKNTTANTIEGMRFLTVLGKVEDGKYYFSNDEVHITLHSGNCATWHVEEVENKPKEQVDKLVTPAIEMRIKGIDDLILQMEKLNTSTILELSLREILLAGGEITIRQSKDL